MISSNCALHRPRIKSLERKEGALGISAVIEQAEKQSEEEKMLDNEQLEFLGDATLEFICRYICVTNLTTRKSIFWCIHTFSSYLNTVTIESH